MDNNVEKTGANEHNESAKDQVYFYKQHIPHILQP